MRTSTAPVLITGCSSGIGAATALRLAKAGYRVYATARDPQRLSALAKAGCHTLPLDVRDPGSMREAVDTIIARDGRIGVLINNAGYSQSGALETLPAELVRAQFETNVIGPLSLCQMVLPHMRHAGAGRIVNVSSMGGKMTFPGFGAYHASKYALEAMSDALRFETANFGVKVILIEPGLIRTGFADAALEAMRHVPIDGPYGTFNAAVAKATQEGYHKGALSWLAGGPDSVAKVITKAITAPHPRARYTVTASARVLLALRRWLGDASWDRFLRGNFPSPGT